MNGTPFGQYRLAHMQNSAKSGSLWEPAALAPFRIADEVRWRLGLDVKLPVKVTPSGQLQPTDLAARALLAIARRVG